MNISTAVLKIIELHKFVPDSLYDTMTHQKTIAKILQELLDTNGIADEYLDKQK